MSWGPVKHGLWVVGRLQIGYRFFIHKSPMSSDRLVFQPYIIWDRK